MRCSWHLIVSFTVVFFVQMPSYASDNNMSSAGPECTDEMALSADSALSKVKKGDWDESYKIYKTFKHCDDGFIASEFEDIIEINLADKWGNFADLDRITKNDQSFLSFVLNHLSKAGDYNKLKTIRTNAIMNCPPDLEKLCGLLIKATDFVETQPVQ